MLYNIKLDTIQRNTQCLECEYYDLNKRKCNGLGITCYEYDELTNTIIDTFTGLPLKREKKEGN